MKHLKYALAFVGFVAFTSIVMTVLLVNFFKPEVDQNYKTEVSHVEPAAVYQIPASSEDTEKTTNNRIERSQIEKESRQKLADVVEKDGNTKDSTLTEARRKAPCFSYGDIGRNFKIFSCVICIMKVRLGQQPVQEA